MSAVVAAIVLSVLSAVGYALAAVAQERVAARQTSSTHRFAMLGAPLWWVSIALNATAASLHVIALRYGSLAVVQPLGALTLVFALPVGAGLAGRRVTAREWRGAAASLVGLGVLLLVVDTGAPDIGLSNDVIAAVGVGTALALALLAGGGPSGTVRGLRLAAAAGIAFGVASVLSQTVVLRLSGSAPLDGSTVAVALAIAALSVLALMLSQAAYRSGLGAPLATQTIVNPVLCAVVGAVLLGQSISPIAACGAVVAALLAGRGVVLLATRSTASAATGSASEVVGAATPRHHPAQHTGGVDRFLWLRRLSTGVATPRWRTPATTFGDSPFLTSPGPAAGSPSGGGVMGSQLTRRASPPIGGACHEAFIRRCLS